MEDIQYLLIISAACIAIASPGPATLAITGTAMSQGRRYGLMLASGVLTGSLLWSCSAAFGLGTLMHANAWLFEVTKYFAASYLLYLSWKSLRSACRNRTTDVIAGPSATYKSAYLKGLFIHLTNPKAIFFFGSLYSLGVSREAGMVDLIGVIVMVGCISATIFLGYAVLFSVPSVQRVYAKSSRIFESIFALFFGVAGIRVLASKLTA